MTDKQTTTVETFLEDSFYALDERLNSRGETGLDPFVNEQACLRGRITARCCVGVDKDGGLLLDITPIDAMRFVCEYDHGDMAWGAAWFTRSRRQIEQEYKIDFGGKEGEVTQFFDKEREIVFVDGKVVREQRNPYGYVPFVQALCPIGSSLGTVEAEKHRGESIFWMNRDLWQEKNRVASIMQTLNMLSIFGSMQYESEKGEAASKPAESPYGHRKVHPVEKGGGYRPMPIGDIKNSTRMFYAVLDAALQRGSLSVVDYGTLQFPLSAIAITRLSGHRDDIFLPVVQGKAMFYQALSRMKIDQTKALDTTVEVGQPGARHSYSKSDLDGDFTISYRFYTESKEQMIADLQVAMHASRFVSRDTIRRDILRIQNPDEEEHKFQSEQAENADEVLFLYRRIESLIEDERYIDAKILLDRILTTIRHRKLQAEMIEKLPEQEQARRENGDRRAQEQAAGELMPLLEGGGGGRRARAPEEPREEREVYGEEV